MKTVGAVVQIILIPLFAGLSVLLWTACQKEDAKPSPKPAPPETILAIDVKCLQPQPNSTVLKTSQNQMHFISQHQLEIRAVGQSNFEYATVHEVLNPSGDVIHSETIKSWIKIEGAADSTSEFDFPWRFPTDLAPGKYQYRIQAMLTELPSQTKQTEHAKKMANTIDFFIK